MLRVLNGQSASQSAPVKTNHSLESAHLEISSLKLTNGVLGLESLINTADSYMSKLEGLTQMHQLLTVMPKVSVESGALIEIASNLLAQGTDLNGAEDLIPGLEAYTQGLEDDSKANGFADTAKRAGEAVLEVIQKILAKLKELWNGIEDRVGKLKTSFTSVKETVESADLEETTMEMEKWAYSALINPAGTEVSAFVNDAKSFTPRIEVPEGKDAGEFYDEVLKDYLRLFSSVGRTDNNVIYLDELDTSKILTYAVAKFEDGKIVKSGHSGKEDRSGNDLESVKVTPEILRAGIIKILKILDDFESFVKTTESKLPDVKKSLNTNDVVETKITLELARLASFTFSQAPEAILSSYQNVHALALKLLKAMEKDAE